MAIDRALWKANFTKDTVPAWPCPRCGNRTLGLMPESLKLLESADSREYRGLDGWEPEYIGGRFLSFLQCGNPTCHEVVACAGFYTTQLHYAPNLEEEESSEVFWPLSFVMPPPVFHLPRECPSDIADEVNAAFALHWSDPWSAANRIRVALELLLDRKGISRKRRLPNKKLRHASLHERIQTYSVTCKNVGDTAKHMMAMKWIGNAGSHGGSVTKDDVLDGFALLEEVLNSLFDPTPGNLKQLSKRINKKKGPLSSRKIRVSKAK
jgi:hypothetical protein